MSLGISVFLPAIHRHDAHIPFDALPKRALPVGLVEGMAAVSDDAVWRKEVAFAIFSRVASVFGLGACSVDGLGSAFDAPLGIDDSGVGSVGLALAEAVVVESALGKIS